MDASSAIRAARALGDLVAENRQTIVSRWLERVADDIQKSPGTELTQLRDGLPDYLHALIEVLRGGRVDELKPLSEAAWAKIAREHGVTRVRLGFDIRELVHEFVVLRHVIAEVIEEKRLESWEIEWCLADVLEVAISASVSAYVNARDYDIRRREAEHIAFLTHELRAPLNNAILSTSMLRGVASEQQLRTLDKLERAHQKLLGMIDGVLLTEKLEAGKAHIERISTTLNEVLEPVLDNARPSAAAKGLELTASFDPTFEISLDRALTQSALQNLLDNAIKYTDQGQVELTVDDTGKDLIFHVRDSCAGISEQELRTIFEPFERGRFGAARGKSGTGLGLAIARGAVEAQGGSIAAESPGPAGCHFWITLPKSASG